MNESKVVCLRQKDEIDDPLTDPLRSGAKRLVQQAMEAEFAAFLASHAELELPDGSQRMFGMDMIRFVRSRWGSGRSRWRSRRRAIAARRPPTTADERIRYASSILPKWARRHEEPRCSFAGSLSARRFHRRFSGSADGLARQGCAEPLSCGDRGSRANGKTSIGAGAGRRRSMRSERSRTKHVCP